MKNAGGCNSAVEYLLPKQRVASSNLVTRSTPPSRPDCHRGFFVWPLRPQPGPYLRRPCAGRGRRSDDSEPALLSLAVRPVAAPPFPLEGLPRRFARGGPPETGAG